MDISNRMSEGKMQELYLRRINGLGKCLLLWASQYSELGSSDPWHYTESNVDHLIDLLDEMSVLADQIDEESVKFWKQMEGILSKVK